LHASAKSPAADEKAVIANIAHYDVLDVLVNLFNDEGSSTTAHHRIE
jgi:hypothetical protein